MDKTWLDFKPKSIACLVFESWELLFPCNVQSFWFKWAIWDVKSLSYRSWNHNRSICLNFWSNRAVLVFSVSDFPQCCLSLSTCLPPFILVSVIVAYTLRLFLWLVSHRRAALWRSVSPRNCFSLVSMPLTLSPSSLPACLSVCLSHCLSLSLSRSLSYCLISQTAR